ncbi:acyltransferase family protein [Roseateles sp. P5_E1]
MTTTNDEQVRDVAAGKPGGYVAALDGVRGLAALAVVLYHIEYSHRWFAKGYLAVDLFFILSGYVLSHRYAASAASRTGFSKFAWARVARLYPLHLATLLLLAAAELCLSLAFNKHAVIPDALGYTFVLNLFLLQCVGLWDHPSWNTSSWSISVEFWVNLGWYCLLGYLKDLRALIVLLLVVWLGGLGLLFAHADVLDYHAESIGFINAGILRCAVGFSCGALVFYMRHQWVGLHEAAGIGFLILFAFLIAVPFESVDFVVAAVLFPILVVAALGKSGWVVKICTWRPVTWLGLISYSIYLNHLLVIKTVNLIGAKLDLLLRGVLILAVTIGLSWLTYRFVESPARAFLQSRWRIRNQRPLEAGVN